MHVSRYPVCQRLDAVRLSEQTSRALAEGNSPSCSTQPACTVPRLALQRGDYTGALDGMLVLICSAFRPYSTHPDPDPDPDVRRSSLLDSSAEIRAIKDRGELVPDTLVGDALLAQIFDPDVNDGLGLVIDGFPRTALQVCRSIPYQQLAAPHVHDIDLKFLPRSSPQAVLTCPAVYTPDSRVK